MPQTCLMMQKILARCSGDKCKYWTTPEKLAENARHDLKCPVCGGSDFKLSVWMGAAA